MLRTPSTALPARMPQEREPPGPRRTRTQAHGPRAAQEAEHARGMHDKVFLFFKLSGSVGWSVRGPRDSVRYMLSTGGMTDTVGTSAHYKVTSISDTVDPAPKMHPQVCSRLGLADFWQHTYRGLTEIAYTECLVCRDVHCARSPQLHRYEHATDIRCNKKGPYAADGEVCCDPRRRTDEQRKQAHCSPESL